MLGKKGGCKISGIYAKRRDNEDYHDIGNHRMIVNKFATPAIGMVSLITSHLSLQFYGPKLTIFDEILSEFTRIFANFAFQTPGREFRVNSDMSTRHVHL